MEYPRLKLSSPKILWPLLLILPVAFWENKELYIFKPFIEVTSESPQQIPRESPSPQQEISPFDELFKHYASALDWDWRILVSLAFHESTFNPLAVSPMGAVGLMQILPSTSLEFGDFDLVNPEENLRASVLYLKRLHESFEKIKDSEERVKFTLASYNVGKGHVEDARRLAEKYGWDPNQWEGHTEKFLIKKSQEEYYIDEVVRYGYCRGEEPVQLVRRVLKKFELYKSQAADKT